MSLKSERVKRWRKATKRRIIKSMGGKCQICSYDKCDSALALHHLDPSQKDLAFGAIRANPKNWLLIVEELRKCILVCHNCHSEIHAGMTQIPEKYSKFDESFVDYKPKKIKPKKIGEFNNCSVCGVEKPVHNKYCSLKCAGKSSRKVDWDSINLEDLYKYKSVVQIAEDLGISDSAVHKRLRILGLK
jgi:hypothetical protein